MLQATPSSLKPGSDSIESLVNNYELQLALLNCAAELVLGEFSADMAFPALTDALNRLPNVLHLWAAAESFVQSLTGEMQGRTAMPDSSKVLLGYMRWAI